MCEKKEIKTNAYRDQNCASAAPPYFIDVVGLDLSHGLFSTVQDRLDVAQFLVHTRKGRATNIS